MTPKRTTQNKITVIIGLGLFIGLFGVIIGLYVHTESNQNKNNHGHISKTLHSGQSGELQYAIRCQKCHGAGGEGTSRAPSLISPHISYRATSKEQIATVISNGIPGSSMPGWKAKLRQKDIQEIARYIIKIREMENSKN